MSKEEELDRRSTEMGWTVEGRARGKNI